MIHNAVFKKVFGEVFFSDFALITLCKLINLRKLRCYRIKGINLKGIFKRVIRLIILKNFILLKDFSKKRLISSKFYVIKL